MKKSTFTFLTLIVCCLTVNAQRVITNNYNSSGSNPNTYSGNSTPVSSSSATRNTSSSDDEENKMGGIDIDYYGVEKGWGIGVEGHNVFLYGAWYCQGETNDVVTSNYGWGMHLGYNLRHWLVPKVLYIEGRLGIGYADTKLETTTYTTTTKTLDGYYIRGHYYEGKTYTSTQKHRENLGGSDFYLMASPRIGLKVCKFNRGGGIAIVGGYRWTFAKFKFDKDHTSDYFSAGISILM